MSALAGKGVRLLNRSRGEKEEGSGKSKRRCSEKVKGKP